MSKNELKPAIRFAGFTDAWEQRKLEQILNQRIEHQKITQEEPLLAFSYSEGVIDPEDKKTNKRDFIMVDKYNKIFSRTEINDIIYNPANVIHGAIHRNKLKNGVVSPIYKIFYPNENISSKYLGERLHTDKFIAEISKYIEGTVVKLRTLSPEKFLDMSIEIPVEYKEQENIGLIFEKINNLITLHQRKYDKLVAVKKSLLEKMFPNDNSVFPDIRFKGYTEAWEQCKYSDIAIIKRGLTYSPNNITNDGIRVLRSSNINDDQFVIYEDDVFVNPNAVNIDKVENGDILITSANGSPRLVGKHAIIRDLKENSAVHGGFMLISRATNYEFVNASMSSNWYREFLSVNVAGGNGAIGNLNATELENYELSIPINNEQIKIGELFSRIDSLITLHQ